MPPLFLRAVFSKFFGRRCLVEGLVSAPAHPLPPPQKVVHSRSQKMAGQSIPYTPITFSAVLPLKVGIFPVNMPPPPEHGTLAATFNNFDYVSRVLGVFLKKGKSSEFNSRHDGGIFGWPTPPHCFKKAKTVGGRNGKPI